MITYVNRSREVLSQLDRAKQNALTVIGMAAEGYAKDETPVDTGRLRNSITHTESEDATYIGTNVEYAPYIEFGAQGRTAFHMLQKAATQHSDEYKRLAERELSGS